MTGEPAVRFGLGLIVGKFAPLHLGHETLIATAARQCERLLILSYTNPEFPRCDVSARRRWLAARAPDHESVVFDDDWLKKACRSRGIGFKPIPPNSADDDTQQRYLGWLLRDVLGRAPDAFFTAEAYGEPCARLLTKILDHEVRPITLDRERQPSAFSARDIRQAPDHYSHALSPPVRAAFVRRIAFLGGESSGKTTLAAVMAARAHTEWVAEFGRELWERQSGVLTREDLLLIANEQILREEAALLRADRYLFCDTSPLTTAGYSQWMFAETDQRLAELAKRSYDGLVLCKPDFDFVQDGTRREEAFRRQQHQWYQDRIAENQWRHIEVGGSVDERVAAVTNWIKDLC